MTDSTDIEQMWTDAMQARQQDDDAGARDLLKSILRAEPRLAEPHLELAHMEIEAGDLDEAEERIRLAIGLLEAGGQWVADLGEDAMLSFAHNLLGEVLFRRADELATDLEPQAFDELWNEAAAAFGRALELDPDNAEASRNAFQIHERRSTADP